MRDMPGVKLLLQNFFKLVKFFLIKKCKSYKSNALLEFQFIILRWIYI